MNTCTLRPTKAILNAPEGIRQHWTGKIGRVAVFSRLYTFYVISGDLPNSPKWFAGYRPDKKCPPFISEDVPGAFRHGIMAHEIFERVRLNGQPDACIRALEFELSRVAPYRFSIYVAFRERMFASLVEYVEDPIHSGGYTDEQRATFRASLDYLRRLS